jgi:hypothetical protein
MTQFIEQLRSIGISPDSYKVNEFSMRPGEDAATVHDEDRDVPANEWQDRYRGKMAGV